MESSAASFSASPRPLRLISSAAAGYLRHSDGLIDRGSSFGCGDARQVYLCLSVPARRDLWLILSVSFEPFADPHLVAPGIADAGSVGHGKAGAVFDDAKRQQLRKANRGATSAREFANVISAGAAEGAVRRAAPGPP